MTPLKTDLTLEQEYNNMAETTINPLTGLPMGGQPTVADSEEGAVKINPLTNEAMTSPAPTVTLGGSPSYTNQMMFRTDYRGNRDISKFDKASISGSDYDVAKGQLLDWEEIRARNQTTADKWGNGLAKAGVTAVGAVAENTLGIMFGLGELASGGAYYDNAIGNKIDETNEWMRENMPNYLTQREEQMNTFQKLGTANFWADTVAGGLGYSLGSIATMYVTGGMGPIGHLSKLGGSVSKTSALYNAAKAVTNGTKLASSLAKGANIGNNILKAAKVAEVGIMMSLAEGSVEARETQKTVFGDLTQEYLQENNLKSLGDIPAAELKKMEDASYAAGNRNFVTQLPVLAGTNLLMFGKQAMGFRGAVKEAGETAFDIASKKAVSNYANDGFWKSTLKKLKPLGANGIEESFQEGAQYFSGQFASKYHSDKYKNNGYADMSEALSHGLSETFGTQEGFESMFVGFLTGMIMGGGRSVVSGEYSQRKAAADKLASFQNAGYFDRANAKAQSANAGSESLKRLKGFQDRGDHKGFKDEQHNLIAINTLQSLEMGGYDVKMEMLEDAKNLSDAEFMKAFGYPGQDAQGNALTLEQQTNGKSKAQVVEGLKAKMEQVKKIYNKVSDRFELPPKSSGLVRKRMSTEERLAEDVVYEERLNLRNELVLRGSRVENNVFRMKNLQQDMNDTINNSLGRGLGPGSLAENYISKALGDFSMFETDPGEMDAVDYNPKKQYSEIRTGLQDAVDTLTKTDRTAGDVLQQQANDYSKIANDTVGALSIYNKLASDPFAQASLQREIEAGQEATRVAEQDKAFNEGLAKAQSSEDVNNLGKELKNPTPAQKAAGNKKYKELKAKEDAQQKKFELVEGTLEERIQKLDDMDKTKMTPIEVAGLNKAIKSLKDLKRRQDAGEIEVVPGEISEDQTGQHKGVNEIEDTFKEAETDLRVVPASDNGREFMIDGKLYTNKRTNPLDAIVRKERSGEIIKVDLVDEDGNRVPFWGPEALVDALAFHIMMSEAYKMEGQPTIEKQETLDKQTAIDNKREKIATKGKHGVKTSELLRREMYEHQMLLEEALENYDDLRTSYMQEAGATTKEIAADPELKEMKKGINKLNTAIRNRRNVLKARGEFLGPTSEELIVIEGKATDRINENEELLTVVQNQIADLESDVEFSQKAIDDYMAKAYDANGRPLPVSDPASLGAAKDDNNKATQKLDQRRQEEIALKNLIDLDKKELKRLQNEKDNRLPGDAEQTGASPAAETKEQVDEGEDTNNRESAEEEGSDVEAQQADIERRREEELAEGKRIQKQFGIPEINQENIESQINDRYDAELSALGQEQPVIVENRGTDDVRVQKAVQDKKAEDRILEDEGGTVIAEFDLINETIMPPVDTSAPTLGESLAAAVKPVEETNEVEIVTYKGNRYSVDFTNGKITNLKTGKVLEAGYTSTVGGAVVELAIAQQEGRPTQQTSEVKSSPISISLPIIQEVIKIGEQEVSALRTTDEGTIEFMKSRHAAGIRIMEQALQEISLENPGLQTANLKTLSEFLKEYSLVALNRAVRDLRKFGTLDSNDVWTSDPAQWKSENNIEVWREVKRIILGAIRADAAKGVTDPITASEFSEWAQDGDGKVESKVVDSIERKRKSGDPLSPIEEIIAQSLYVLGELRTLPQHYTQPTQQSSGAPVQQTPAMIGDLGIDAASDDKVIMHEGRSKIPVASTGEVDVQVDTLNGDPILLNKDMLVTGNGKSIVGTTVEFEVIENDYYKETYGDTLNEANIPIYYKIGGKIVGKLQASDNANRAELVKRLKSGEKVTSTISSVVAGNVNNARTTDGQSYFRNPNNVFGNGQVVLGTVKSLEGTRFFTAGTMSESKNNEFSNQETIEEGLIAKSPEGAITGGVAIIIRPENHPAGEVGVSMASTAELTDGAKAAVVNALRAGNFDVAKEIIAHSVGESRFANRLSTDYLEFGQFGNDGAEYMVYNSPAGDGFVRINKPELIKALRNEPFQLNFVEVKGDNKLANIKDTDAKYDSVKNNFIKDFNTFLNGKKYQVDNNRVNLDGAYTSPVTGNDYSSYQEYLFSDKEGVNRMPGYGHQSIVATDVVNTSSGLHHNVQVKFSLGDLNGDTAADVMKITNFAKRSRRGGGARARLASPYAQDKKSPNLNEGCK